MSKEREGKEVNLMKKARHLKINLRKREKKKKTKMRLTAESESLREREKSFSEQMGVQKNRSK